MEYDLKFLGKEIKLERIRKDLSQEQLANILRVSPRTISLIENGKQHPKFFLMVKIAKFFDVELSKFISKC